MLLEHLEKKEPTKIIFLLCFHENTNELKKIACVVNINDVSRFILQVSKSFKANQNKLFQ